MKSVYLYLFPVILIISSCAGRPDYQNSTEASSDEPLSTEGMAVIHRSGLPGILRSTYARVIRIDDQTFYQHKQAVIDGGPHQIQIECEVCDASLFVFKNCITYLSEFLSVRLQENTQYKAECSADLQREEIEFTLIETDSGDKVAQYRRAAN